jgi:hypothetical protein
VVQQGTELTVSLCSYQLHALTDGEDRELGMMENPVAWAAVDHNFDLVTLALYDHSNISNQSDMPKSVGNISFYTLLTTAILLIRGC